MDARSSAGIGGPRAHHDELLSPETVRKLQALNLNSRLRRPGQLRGDRRSTKRGTSVEFADYRTYAPGDDLRRVDWNLYARTDRLFLKIYEEEEDRAVHLLVDTSASMGFGDPAKLETAQRLAAALGYVALHELDRLQVVEIRAGGPHAHRPLRGATTSAQMLRYLAGTHAGGRSTLNRALREYAGRSASAGLLILISDLLDPDGITGGLRALAGRGHEITVLHVLTDDELEPAFAGDLELVDSETGDRQGMTLDRAAVEAYDRRLQLWLNEIKAACTSVHASYNLVRTSQPVDEVLFGQLRNAQVLV